MSGLWGGRFQNSADGTMFRLSKSTDLDWRLAPYDIAGSLAHLKALTKGGLIDSKIRCLRPLTGPGNPALGPCKSGFITASTGSSVFCGNVSVSIL